MKRAGQSHCIGLVLRKTIDLLFHHCCSRCCSLISGSLQWSLQTNTVLVGLRKVHKELPFQSKRGVRILSLTAIAVEAVWLRPSIAFHRPSAGQSRKRPEAKGERGSNLREKSWLSVHHVYAGLRAIKTTVRKVLYRPMHNLVDNGEQKMWFRSRMPINTTVWTPSVRRDTRS